MNVNHEVENEVKGEVEDLQGVCDGPDEKDGLCSTDILLNDVMKELDEFGGEHQDDEGQSDDDQGECDPLSGPLSGSFFYVAVESHSLRLFERSDEGKVAEDEETRRDKNAEAGPNPTDHLTPMMDVSHRSQIHQIESLEMSELILQERGNVDEDAEYAD